MLLEGLLGELFLGDPLLGADFIQSGGYPLLFPGVGDGGNQSGG